MLTKDCSGASLLGAGKQPTVMISGSPPCARRGSQLVTDEVG